MTSLGVNTALAIDAASFLVAAWLLRGVPELRPEALPQASDSGIDDPCQPELFDDTPTLRWLW